jgi:hypothetical protein
MIMTEDKARKLATRQRMAQTGEPYSVARHAVEDEHASPAAPHDGMPGDAGATEAGAPPLAQADQARRMADQARMLADQARIRAERAGETADGAEEAADLTQEAAELTQEWGSDEEIGRALRRADEARTAAGQARSRAEQAERLAEEAEEAADHAAEAADGAGNPADDSEDGPPRWHHRPSRPASPPRPPRPPRPPHGRHYGPADQDDSRQPGTDPAERLQNRVDQFIRRLSVARDQADRLISAAESVFTPARSEPVHRDPAAEPGPADPA